MRVMLPLMGVVSDGCFLLWSKLVALDVFGALVE